MTWLPKYAITQLCYSTDDTIWYVKLFSFGVTGETYNQWSQDDLTKVSLVAENFGTKGNYGKIRSPLSFMDTTTDKVIFRYLYVT